MKSEYVSPDILEQNLVKCFAPIHITQFALGSLRVDIRDQFVTYNTTKQRLYRLMTAIAGTLTICEIMVDYYNVFKDYTIVYVTFLAPTLMFYVTHISSHIHITYFNQNDNIAIYHNLQKIDNFLKLDRLVDVNNTKYYVHIILITLLLLGVVPLVALFFFLILGHLPVTSILGGIGTVFMHVELLLMTSFLFYLTDRLKILRSIFKIKVSRDMNQVYGTLGGKTITLDKHLLPIVESVTEQKLGGYVTCLNDILLSVKLTGKLYNFQILSFTATIFVWAFLVIAASVEGTQVELIPWIALVLMYFYLANFFIVVFTIVYICHSFGTEIKDLRCFCTNILARSCELNNDPVREVAKKMLRLTEHEPHLISVYGIFTIDLGLPLRLIALIATYTIILMQLTIL